MLTYDDIKVQLVSGTPEPDKLITNVMKLWGIDNCYQYQNNLVERISQEELRSLIVKNHTSVLEHVNLTFFIDNISKNLMTQLVRHRIGSFTFSSQHYQNFNGKELIIKDFVTTNVLTKEMNHVRRHYYETIKLYQALIDNGVDKSDARAILPGGIAHCGFWTVNVRSLINFLNLRLCHRNVEEMVIFANKIFGLALDYWYELFIWAGPDCYMPGKLQCQQGNLTCSLDDNEKQFPKTVYEATERQLNESCPFE